MPPSLARRWGEELRVADDCPHVLVKEIWLAGDGLTREDVVETR